MKQWRESERGERAEIDRDRGRADCPPMPFAAFFLCAAVLSGDLLEYGTTAVQPLRPRYRTEPERSDDVSFVPRGNILGRLWSDDVQRLPGGNLSR